MADSLKTPTAAVGSINAANRPVEKSANNTSYWKRMLKSYEKRNASLERRRSALAERIRFMECTLPSLLVGAVTSSTCGKRGIPDEHMRILEKTPKSTTQSK